MIKVMGWLEDKILWLPLWFRVKRLRRLEWKHALIARDMMDGAYTGGTADYDNMYKAVDYRRKADKLEERLYG